MQTLNALSDKRGLFWIVRIHWCSYFRLYAPSRMGLLLHRSKLWIPFSNRFRGTIENSFHKSTYVAALYIGFFKNFLYTARIDFVCFRFGSVWSWYCIDSNSSKVSRCFYTNTNLNQRSKVRLTIWLKMYNHRWYRDRHEHCIITKQNVLSNEIKNRKMENTVPTTYWK